MSRELVKLTVETALGKEMEEHLGYARHSPEGRGAGNSRNGASKKTLKGQMGEVEISTTVFPKAQVQLCIVHMVRNSLKYVSYKDRKAVAADLKRIYQSITVEEAEIELKKFGQKWDSRYPSIMRYWTTHWENIIPLFNYPDEIRKIIYTTNAIESVNSVIRKAIKNRRIFPNDSSAFKVVFLAIQKACAKWTMPIRNWKPAMNRFLIQYEDRFADI